MYFSYRILTIAGLFIINKDTNMVYEDIIKG